MRSHYNFKSCLGLKCMEVGIRNKIIVQPEVFTDSYLPEKLFHRENEFKTIVDGIMESYGNENSIVIIWGTPGVGKTAILRKSLIQFEKEFRKDAVVTYYDGISKTCNTFGKVLRNLVKRIWPSARLEGISDIEIANLLVNSLKTKEISVIVGIDEAHNVLQKSYKVFEHLMSSEDVEGRIHILLATIEGQWVYPYITMKDVTKTRTVELRLYDEEELLDIVSDRAERGLRLGSYEEDILDYIANISAKKEGTARFAIQLLRTSAEIAENVGREVITPEDVRYAIDIVPGSISLSKILALDFSGRLTLYAAYRALRNKAFVTISDIYEELRQVAEELSLESNKTIEIPARTTVHDRLKSASRMGLILSEERKINKKIRSRYYVDFPTEKLFEELKRNLLESLSP